MLTLAISHNIFLTSEQRHALYQRDAIEVVGISVPVWFYQGNTSEPANEVFCKYILTNLEEDYPVTSLAKGYKINLPQLLAGHNIYKRPDKKDWDNYTEVQKAQWNKEYPMVANGYDLLDIEEGGLESVKFKRYDKIKENEKRMNIIHSIEICDEKVLKESIAY